MANNKHLEMLKKGRKAWNQWRVFHPDIQPDLSYLNLRASEFSRLNLSFCILESTDLTNARISNSDLKSSNLRSTKLGSGSLSYSNLTHADLSNADLSHCNLSYANMSYASLRGAYLHSTDFNRSVLAYADMSDARAGGTRFADLDLSHVQGLTTVIHDGPSTIGIDTIYKSKGAIPEIFLRGIGIPKDLIENIKSLSKQAIEFYSCFISYSSRDQEFVERLYADLQHTGTRCWYAPEDLRIGDRLRPSIDESIRLHDKLLLILSENSVTSQWVDQEVETALAKERERNQTVLFPIRLDNAIMEMNTGWPALIKNTRHVGDFTGWKDHDSYKKAFERLLRDLKT